MDDERIVRLRRLRDEVYDCYRSAPSSQLLHALMFRTGPRLTPEDEKTWWNDIGCFIGLPPLGHTIWAARHESSFEVMMQSYVVEQHYFGEEGDRVHLTRFIDQAKRVIRQAREVMKSVGIAYVTSTFNASPNWAAVCYMLAWDYPNAVSYSLQNYGFPSNGDIYACAPIRNRKDCELYEAGKLRPNPGTYFVTITSDIRLATVDAIDAILAIVAKSADLAGSSCAASRDASTGRVPVAGASEPKRPDSESCLEPPGSSPVVTKPFKLTDRQELILDAVGKLGVECRRGKAIAADIRLTYDQRLRQELSTLKKFGFLGNDGAGYFRTSKPYPCQ